MYELIPLCSPLERTFWWGGYPWYPISPTRRVLSLGDKQIGRAIFKRQTAEEVQTGEIERNWVVDLPYILKYINLNAEEEFIKKKDMVEADNDPLISGKKKTLKLAEDVPHDPEVEVFETDILPIGQQVRVQLDKPVEVTKGDKLHGRFRETDIRFSTQLYTIYNTIIQDNMPAMYIVQLDNKIIPVAYTRNQLQVIDKVVKPSEDLISKKKQMEVKEILDKKIINGRVHYLIKWNRKGEEDSYEPRTTLINEIPDMIKEYEKTH